MLQAGAADEFTPLKSGDGVAEYVPDIDDETLSEDMNIVHVESRHVEKNKLGTLNGVYAPCLLNIMGVILFERLGWSVGQLGVGYVLLIILVAELQTVSTTLSLSAIVTNGNMRGGGSYYMISRTLGPEFGGSIGILFYCASCVSTAFNCVGCAAEAVNTWYSRFVFNCYLFSLVFFFCFSVVCLFVVPYVRLSLHIPVLYTSFYF